jgi:hypothetical protein
MKRLMTTMLLRPQLNELNSLFSRFDAPPAGQYDGWYQYFDRDIRKLLGLPQPQPFANSYCGAGNRHRCQKSIWAAIASAGRQLNRQQKTADPAAWRASGIAERIKFVPNQFLPIILGYTNRPSGIQQIISFDGHR